MLIATDAIFAWASATTLAFALPTGIASSRGVRHLFPPPILVVPLASGPFEPLLFSHDDPSEKADAEEQVN